MSTSTNRSEQASAAEAWKGARIVTPSGVVASGVMAVQEGTIRFVGDQEGFAIWREENGYKGEIQELPSDSWLLPGFIDLHVHGGYGSDFMDADTAAYDAITRFHAAHGTTSMLATTMTAPREEIEAVLHAADHYRKASQEAGFWAGAHLAGVHLEGPFISPRWPGAQNPKAISLARIDWLTAWHQDHPDLLRLVTLAPEREGALDAIAWLAAHGITAALGHTDASYEEVEAAAAAGLRHAVHTYNAMKPLHHREPGTVGAVMTDDRITAEVIADGHHVHPASIQALLRCKGADRLVLITDAMSAAGLGDGSYELGGLPVTMRDGICRLTSGGSLAGSTLTMIQAFRFMVSQVGVSVADASRMASLNPAKVIGLDKITGSLEAGKRADWVILDDRLKLQQVGIGGRKLDLEC